MVGEVRVRMVKDGYFPINESMAGLVPMASEADQVALNDDIAENGQKDPIVLWRGEIVDGRCRQKALQLIHGPVIYKELDPELSEEDVRVVVKSLNTRRSLTLTQKGMVAAYDSLKPNSNSIPVVAKSWGVGRGTVDNARYIIKQDDRIAKRLFDGESVDIVNKDGKEVSSNKITAVYAYLKRKEEGAKKMTKSILGVLIQQ